MARLLFEMQGIRQRNGRLASGVTYVAYTDEAGTALADISATSGGSAIAGSTVTTSDIAGLGPAAFRFYGPPSGQDTLYLRCPADASLGVQEIEADEDERLDALEAGGLPPVDLDRLDVLIDEGPRNPMSAVWAGGAAGDGSTNDSAAFTALLASFGSRGGEIELPPRVFRIPNGVTESIPGLVVRGQGHRYLGPIVTADDIGAVIFTENVGQWCWTHENPTAATFPDYWGASFEGVNFVGNAITAGGLRSQAACTSVTRCGASGHTTGTGFQVQPTGVGSDDASWAVFFSNIAFNCLTGYEFGGDETSGTAAASPEIVNCFTLKSGAGGIAGTGTGYKIRCGNTTVLGGKAEGDGIGWLVTAGDAVTLIGPRAEGCTTAISLDRDAGWGFGSRHRVVTPFISASCTTAIHIGANEVDDTIFAPGTSLTTFSDSGTNTQIFGDPRNRHVFKLGTADFNTYLAVPNSAGTNLFRVFGDGSMTLQRRAGDSTDRLDLDGFAALRWGGGSGAVDTQLRRAGTAHLATDGHFSLETLGKSLRVKEGSNACMGTVALTAGAATVATTAVTANSRIQLTAQDDGGTPGFLRVSTRTAGTSFVITSSSGADTSVVAWLILEPA